MKGVSSKYYLKITGLLCAVFFLLNQSSAQNVYQDFKLWASIGVKKNITQRLSADLSLTERTMENVSQQDQFFAEAGLSYEITKSVKIGGFYRFINKNSDNEYLSKRHRWFADLTLKTKFNPVTLSLRSRYQWTVKDAESSDYGYLPESYWRNKISAKFDLEKKYTPYLACEAFMLTNSLADAGFIDAIRYAIGSEYEFNRMHSVDASFIYQVPVVSDFTYADYILSIGYQLTF